MRIIDPGTTIENETIRGPVKLYPGATMRHCTIDAHGALYGIECVDSHPWDSKSLAPLFLARRSIIEGCEVFGAQNACILARWTEIRGGWLHDSGNDAIKTAAPTWIHGHLYGLVIDRLGVIALDPDGHVDGIQTWAPTLVEGRVKIDTRKTGPGYQERGAGIFIKPDFGQCGPVIVRNGVTMISGEGYCMQVVPDGTGLEPRPVKVSRCYFHREDGKHPVNVLPSVEWERNRFLDGRPLEKVPA